MTTYLVHKGQVFHDHVVESLACSRSEGRLKTYPSTTDARTWCFDIEDRRRQIIELVTANREKIRVGRYVPIEVLIDTLLTNKEYVIDKLKKILSEYREKLRPLETVDFSQNVSEECYSDLRQDSSSSYGSKEVWKRVNAKSRIPCLIRTSRTASLLKLVCGSTNTIPSPEVITKHDYTDTDDTDDLCINNSSFAITQVDLYNTELLQDELKQKESECQFYKKTTKRAIGQLEALQNIMEERNDLRRKLEESLNQLEILKKKMKDPCQEEIEVLEQEILRLRTVGKFTPKDEIIVLQKEITLLKTYSSKIRQVQEENSKLQRQLSQIQELSGIPSKRIDMIDTNDPEELKARLMELKTRFAKVEEIIDERDQLRARTHILESELDKYEDPPEEVDIFRKRSILLNDVLDERNDLQKRLDEMECLEGEMVILKKKADRASLLEVQVKSLNLELRRVKSESVEEITNIKNELIKEYEKKNLFMADAADEIERLRVTEKEASILKLERDKLKLKIYELAGGDAHKTNNTSIQCGYMEDLLAERDLFKYKYEELLGLDCQYNSLRTEVENYRSLDIEHQKVTRLLQEKELCIKHQENEISKLVNCIDHLSCNSKIQQSELDTIQAELEEKNMIIAGSKEVLVTVGDQLKYTISSVSCETTHLKTCIDSLTKELEEATHKVKLLEEEIAMLRKDLSWMEELMKEKDDVINSLRQNLKDIDENEEIVKSLHSEILSFRDENEQFRAMLNIDTDEHFEKMLKQSKIAVERVAEYL